MHELLLYCLNEKGGVVSTERLAAASKAELRDAAQARLSTCTSVEIWDGAICILRVHAGASDTPCGS